MIPLHARETPNLVRLPFYDVADLNLAGDRPDKTDIAPGDHVGQQQERQTTISPPRLEGEAVWGSDYPSGAHNLPAHNRPNFGPTE
ncbi:hypothetical protein D3C71_1052500 [compost metagenome]